MSKSKADQYRLDQIHNMPCICCQIEGRGQPFRTEAHHIVSNGYRRLSGGHQSTIPRYSRHHRGQCLEGLNVRKMTSIYGPSLFHSKKGFIKHYGGELALLEMINEILGEPNEQR